MQSLTYRPRMKKTLCMKGDLTVDYSKMTKDTHINVIVIIFYFVIPINYKN